MLCASATRLFASATRRAKSSVGVPAGAGDAECGVAGTGGVDTGLGVATADVEADADGAPFFIAAIFAVISALFWAMRSAVACGQPH